MTLLSQSFFEDTRVSEAKRLLLETLLDYQKQLTSVRSPSRGHKLSYRRYLDKLGQLRGGALWYPYLSSGLGNGALVELMDGSVKYDFINGIGAFFGHSLPDIVESGIDAALQDTTMQGNLQQNKSTLHLLDLLVTHSGLDHGFLTSSGVMANENALKMIFQKKAPASRFLVFEKCFMGRTLAVSQLTDKAAYREGLPPMLSVDYVPFYDYRTPKKSIQRAVSILKAHLKRYPGQYAGMCFEMVQGEAGYYPGSRDFFVALMDVLKQESITIMVDEVQTFGRTDSLFAIQHFELTDYVDVLTFGKLSQVCGTLFRSSYKPRPGLVSQTFTSSTSAIEAALVIVSSLINDNYLGPHGKIMTMHHYIVKQFKVLEKKYPKWIEGPFGIGSMVAFTPYKGQRNKVIAFSKSLFDDGVIGFIAGDSPTRLRFLLPMGGITKHDIDRAMDIVEYTLMRCA